MSQSATLPSLTAMPHQRSGLEVTSLPGELLIYDPRRGVAHRLDAVAAAVFEACDGRDPAAWLAELQRLAPDADLAELLLGELERLMAAGLVESCPDLPRAGERANPDDPTRRAMLAGLGAAVPFVTSVLAPSPVAAVSLGFASLPVVGSLPSACEADCGLATEGYDFLEENPFRRTSLHPVATFGADVDSASYSNARRFLLAGQLPPAEAIRLEELLNAFRYDDAVPAGGDSLELTAELGPCPWRPEHDLLRLGVQATRIPVDGLPPRNLVFLLDVSGSMAAADKLPLVKNAMFRLAETLDERDRVAIVVYAGASGVVLPPTPGSRLDAIGTALGCLEAGGSTAGAAGIEAAYQLARQNLVRGGINRVILCTDGDFNVGVTSRGALIELISRQRASGVDLSVLGFGTGNLKDSSLEQLADHGNGTYAYIDSLDEARRVLVGEGGATLLTLARDVKLQVEWNPARVYAWRLIGYENRLLERQDFEDESKDAGDLGAGHHVTVLFELDRGGSEHGGAPDETRPLRYQRRPELTAAAAADELGQLRLRYRLPESERSDERSFTLDRSTLGDGGSADFHLAAGIATFGLLLRRSRYAGEASWRLAGELVGASLGGDRDGTRRQLMELIDVASRLSTTVD